MSTITVGDQVYLITKEYDFRTMNHDDVTDVLDTSNVWPRKEIINNQLEYLLDPSKVPAVHSPFVLSETGLAIKGVATHPDIEEHAWGILKADLESYSNSLTDSERLSAFPMPYTSGLLTTNKNGAKFKQKYGYWEISAKLPSKIGCWPAFWLLLLGDGWPSGVSRLSEIDIMEAVKDVLEGKYHATAHSNERGGLASSENNIIDAAHDLTENYHRFGAAWEEDYIVWYFDGVEVKRYVTPDDMKDLPAYAIVNLAIGGSFDNEQEPGSWVGIPDPIDFETPALFEIEYMRIYAKVTPDAPVDDLGPLGEISDIQKVEALTIATNTARWGDGLTEGQRDYLISLYQRERDAIQ